VKRFAVLMAFAWGLVFVVPQASFAEIYYVCWKRVRMEFRGCTRCSGPFVSYSPSVKNARTQCPNEQGEDFNTERDARDWMTAYCDCP
jgi:hypothetical protein